MIKKSNKNLYIYIGNKKVKKAYLGNILKYKSTKQVMISVEDYGISYTYDGINWVQVTNISPNGQTLDITYYNGYFYLTNGGNRILQRSSNLTNWETISTASKSEIYKLPHQLIHDGIRFIGGKTGMNNRFVLNNSLDGIDWEYQTTTKQYYVDNLNRIYNFNGITLFAFDWGIMYKTQNEEATKLPTFCNFTRLDGSTYIIGDTDSHMAFWGMCIANNVIYAISNGNYGSKGLVNANSSIWKSLDGINWTEVYTTNTASKNYYYDISYLNGKFVVVGTNSSGLISLDGINWNTIELPKKSSSNTTSKYEHIETIKNKFVTPNANNHVYYSIDGITWTEDDAYVDTRSLRVFEIES